MKIGIVTYWKSYCNYGEQLQNYALQEYLRGMGQNPFLICYDYENDTIYGSRPLPVRIARACNPQKLAGYFRSKKNNRNSVKDALEHPRGFESFREKYLKMSRLYSSIDDLRNDPPVADVYITGSDQVWNTFEGGLIEMRNRVSAFFLDFGGDSIKRVSYAASWGREELPEEERRYISPLISRFDVVSVREKSGIGICSGLGYDGAVWAIDPVLLHDAEKYRKLYRESSAQKTEDKYLLFYYMNNDGDYDRQVVFDWAASNGLKVIYVTDDWHDDFSRSFPSVEEWLELIDNAECVVTNSYHCVLFSLIFEKRFGVIRRFGGYTGMNTRMDSVFQLCGIDPRFIDDCGFEMLERPADRINMESMNKAAGPETVLATVLG